MKIKELISPQAWEKFLQDEGTNIMIGIRDINDTIIYYLLIIVVLVGYILMKYVKENIRNINKVAADVNIRNITHSTNLEVVWTIFPAVILIIIAIPSLKLLYTMEEIIKPLITLKVKANQWYWSYGINDYENLDINFDSYIVPDSECGPGSFRLLEVDQGVSLPVNTPVRLLITSEDVIHSFGIPSLGIKIDAIPGRLNLGYLNILRPGTYYGQCYELCGQAHALMPIKINAVKEIDYYYWLFSNFTK